MSVKTPWSIAEEGLAPFKFKDVSSSEVFNIDYNTYRYIIEVRLHNSDWVLYVTIDVSREDVLSFGPGISMYRSVPRKIC